MTSAEFKLIAAAAIFLVLVGWAINGAVRETLRVRELRKRKERYTEWFNLQFIRSLTTRDRALRRYWMRLDTMRDTLADFESDENWEQWEQHCQEVIGTRLEEVRRDRPDRPRVDYSRYNERIADV